MKRIDLVRHLQKEGCTLKREGAKHSVFLNPVNGKMSTVPRHNEINAFTAKSICKDLEIEPIGRK